VAKKNKRTKGQPLFARLFSLLCKLTIRERNYIGIYIRYTSYVHVYKWR